ncbi:MAG: chromosome segregation protein SMC, partial [Pseudomonadota bacterium]|nr:chromosome segregation protein SMC [Pseudomonadota bacterium]
LTDIGQRLEAKLEARLAWEEQLTAARQALEAQDAELKNWEQARGERERQAQALRQDLEALRLKGGERAVRRQTLADQLAGLGADVQEVLAQLPAAAEEADLQAQLERLGERIQRLGAVNLAAIDECAQLAQRHQYLEAQHADLVQALETLENAMRRLDRETRSRFQDTLERVDAGLQGLFPRLFGGGQAHLTLTGDDVLDAGVAIMARPPGKRIGTIHLLSGGEKALTAVALVFAIFQLNPAPFCMLDEVDAPLDEANVGRFGALVQELSERVQFILITHNKGTMEIASHLAGVTMHEPGVSRLVAVDVDEAVRLAAV